MTGPAGFDGIHGSKGPNGRVGTTGARGTQGADGYGGRDGAKGPRGATGDQGFSGVMGNQGAMGPTGARGESGDVGGECPEVPADVVFVVDMSTSIAEADFRKMILFVTQSIAAVCGGDLTNPLDCPNYAANNLR